MVTVWRRPLGPVVAPLAGDLHTVAMAVPGVLHIQLVSSSWNRTAERTATTVPSATEE